MSAASAANVSRELRQLIADRFPSAVPLTERRALGVAAPVAIGIAALDAALPSGGLPRGKVTAWSPAGGVSAILREACRATLRAGERAAWVDGTQTASFGWTTIEPAETPLLVRSPDRLHALRAAEALLGSGAFGLVILDLPPRAEPLGTEVVRLGRAAREGGGAFVSITPSPALAMLRVTSRLILHGVRGMRWLRDPFGAPALPRAVRAEVRVRAMGWNASAEVHFRIAPYDLRCALEPGVDRRRVLHPSDLRPNASDESRGDLSDDVEI